MDIQKAISKARAKYLYGDRLPLGFSIKQYTDPDLKPIEKAIEKTFNFRTVDFIIEPAGYMNAFCVPCGYSLERICLFGDKVCTKNGYKFKHKVFSGIIFITSAIWTEKKFTDEEILSIILHEIGHCFNHAINGLVNMYMSGMFLNSIISSISRGPKDIANLFFSLPTGMHIICKISKTFKIVGLLMAALSTFKGLVTTIQMEIQSLINMATLGLFGPVKMTQNLAFLAAKYPHILLHMIIDTIPGKGMEVLSDNFATDFGYGPELSSALLKMELSTDMGLIGDIAKDKSKVYRDVYAIAQLPMYVIQTIIDEHPITPKRVQGIVANLNEELKKSDLSPAMKKEIQNQIQDVKDMTYMYTKTESERVTIGSGDLNKYFTKLLINFDKDPRSFIVKLFSDKHADKYSKE